MSTGVSSGEFLFLSWYWLGLIPLFWGFLLWWMSPYRGERGASHSSSIADINISSHHYYHPYADKLASSKGATPTKKLKAI